MVPWLVGSTIFAVFSPGPMASRVVILSPAHICSDHSALLLKVSPPAPIQRGPGRWQLNSSILQDPYFVSLFESFWASWKLRKRGFPSLQLWCFLLFSWGQAGLPFVSPPLRHIYRDLSSCSPGQPGHFPLRLPGVPCFAHCFLVC